MRQKLKKLVKHAPNTAAHVKFTVLNRNRREIARHYQYHTLFSRGADSEALRCKMAAELRHGGAFDLRLRTPPRHHH
jgi:hypothetical protein